MDEPRICGCAPGGRRSSINNICIHIHVYPTKPAVEPGIQWPSSHRLHLRPIAVPRTPQSRTCLTGHRRPSILERCPRRMSPRRRQNADVAPSATPSQKDRGLAVPSHSSIHPKVLARQGKQQDSRRGRGPRRFSSHPWRGREDWAGERRRTGDRRLRLPSILGRKPLALETWPNTFGH